MITVVFQYQPIMYPYARYRRWRLLDASTYRVKLTLFRNRTTFVERNGCHGHYNFHVNHNRLMLLKQSLLNFECDV